MKIFLFQRILIITILALNLTTFAGETEYIVIAVIDGARYSETFGDTSHKYIPHMWNNLVPQGTLYTNFYNNGWTKTNPGHSAILTGTWQNLANDGTQRPNMPTIFEYSRKAFNDSINNYWVILGKDKLDILSNSNHLEYGTAHRNKLSMRQRVRITRLHTAAANIIVHHPCRDLATRLASEQLVLVVLAHCRETTLIRTAFRARSAIPQCFDFVFALP